MKTEQEQLRSVMRPVALYLGILVLAGILCVIGLAVLYMPVWRMNQAVSAYTGDGVITVTSTQPFNPGYRIDFAPFDMSRPYQAEYTLQNFPRIDAPARVALYFSEISDRVYGIRGGALAVEVRAGDRSVMEADAPIDDWNFSEQIGITVTYFDFKTQDRSSFPVSDLPESATPTLHVRYTPAEDVDPTLRGHIRLQVGG